MTFRLQKKHQTIVQTNIRHIKVVAGNCSNFFVYMVKFTCIVGVFSGGCYEWNEATERLVFSNEYVGL